MLTFFYKFFDFTFRPDWNTAKQVMSDMNFLKKLQDYDANHIPETTIKKLKPYVEHKDFQPAVSQSKFSIKQKLNFFFVDC